MIIKRYRNKSVPMQCEICMRNDDDYCFYERGWFIEGQFYCDKHKDGAISFLEKLINKGRY